MLGLLNIFLRHRRRLFFIPLTTAVLSVILAFLLPVWYAGAASFVPESPDMSQLAGNLSSLAGLASQVGLNIGNVASQSPDFYARVLRSRELEERVLLTRFPNPDKKPDSLTFLEILGVDGRDSPDSLHNGVKKIDKLLSIDVDEQTNVVAISVEAPTPDLAAAVANAFLAYLNDFNTYARQSQGRARREFLEQRVAAGRQSLLAAEDSLRSFYVRNRTWQGSPDLTFQEGRVHREVDIQQDLYLTLSHEYEAARVSEVDDTPELTIIDHASPPQEKARPKRALIVIVGFFFGIAVAVIWSTMSDHLAMIRDSGAPEYAETTTLVAALRHDLLAISRRLRRRRGTTAT